MVKVCKRALCGGGETVSRECEKPLGRHPALDAGPSWMFPTSKNEVLLHLQFDRSAFSLWVPHRAALVRDDGGGGSAVTV
ncbi:hypothetical protein [Pseudovibrio sp. W64]|uniref:hypothetical protein n=1 Tax=Pseudovibrio sp. W64 TaxID=1735583 RepID=UPI0012906BAA|nr:hypothetical protein [Pseudovibrio sp. W64]